jgi:hypothetical protein
MDAVVGDAVGSEEIVGVSKVDEGVILNSCPGENDPGDKPEHEDWNRQTINPIDQNDRLSLPVES